MRMWEIREGYEKDGYRRGRGRMGMRHEKTVEEAYECGYEDGYEAAMEDMEEKSSHRMGLRSRMYLSWQGWIQETNTHLEWKIIWLLMDDISIKRCANELFLKCIR